MKHKFLYRVFSLMIVWVFVLGTLSGGIVVHAQDDTPPQKDLEGRDSNGDLVLPQTATDRIIVKFESSSSESPEKERPSDARMAILSDKSGVPMRYFRTMSDGAQILQFSEKLPFDQVMAISQSLMELSDVEYAEPDARMYHTLTPNDTQYADQWHYYESYGVNLPAAWDITTGSVSVVVAVVDSGITNHSEFSGRVVQGYDFVSTALDGNDGDARDSDASDPGDWVTVGESASGWFTGCPVENSSWHGTHVAGTIAANSNNAVGVAGVNWNAKILPVRVLGKCGGYLSDIADGIRWAAGGSVAGVPANANPAKVINLSIGGGGACGTTYQSAIDAATSLGAIVVVAAGNEAMDASNSRPANCNNVITVSATDRSGYLSSYSNYGTNVDISAPGGDLGWDTGIVSTYNTGITSPVSESYSALDGTSMAAPHVSGVISLMLSVTPTLTPSQITEIIQNTAKDFNPLSICTSSPTTCGAGIVDAAAAVKAARFYNWAGGVSITSDRALVSVARPHVGAEITTYNGFFNGANTAFIPMLFKDAFGGSYDSAFYIQNVSTNMVASITIQYYDNSGSLNCTKNDTINPLASKGYWVPSASCDSGSLPVGWVGGVKVTSNQPIVAVGRPHIGAEVMTYNGFSAGTTTSFIPMLFKGAFGGSYDAAFYIQNVHGTNAASITIEYYDNTGALNCTKSDTINPLASKGYWVPAATCDTGSLPAGWVGGVKVTSNQPIVAVGRPHIGSQITTYNGEGSPALGSSVPMLFKGAFGGSYDSAFYIQNTSGSTANVTIQYYDNAGTLNCTKSDTISPLASKGYWVPAATCDTGSLPAGWAGGVIITSNQNVVTVGRPHIGTQITTYTGSTGAATAVSMPMLFKDAFGGSYDSALYLQNTNALSANVNLFFYNASGQISCTVTTTIAPNAIKGFWLPGLSTSCIP